MRLNAKNHCPHDGVQVVRIDILVDNDEDLAEARSQARGGIERLPGMGRLARFELDDEQAPAAAFFVNRDLLDAAHADAFFQTVIENRFGGDLLELAAFAGRMGSHEVEQDRIFPLVMCLTMKRGYLPRPAI